MEPHDDSGDSADLGAAIASAAAGDADSLALLAKRAATLALRTASALISDREDVRDISQDVALEVLRSLEQLRDPEAFDAWVHRIAVRRTSRVMRLRSIVHRREIPIVFADGVGGGDGFVDAVARRRSLAKAIGDLPQRQRIVLALRYVHDLSDAEIARALGCQVGTVHSALSRARQALRTSPTLSGLNPVIKKGS